MSTVQEMYDDVAGFDGDAAETFKSEMVAAMMDTEVSFTAKGAAGLRKVATTWADKRDFLKKMQDPAFRAMAVGVVAEEYGMELPVEAELEVLAAQENSAEDDTDAEAVSDETEPSFT